MGGCVFDVVAGAILVVVVWGVWCASGVVLGGWGGGVVLGVVLVVLGVVLMVLGVVLVFLVMVLPTQRVHLRQVLRVDLSL